MKLIVRVHVVRRLRMRRTILNAPMALCLILYSPVVLLSAGLPVANAPDVLQPCGLLYYP